LLIAGTHQPGPRDNEEYISYLFHVLLLCGFRKKDLS
jgi:hypothetical protein